MFLSYFQPHSTTSLKCLVFKSLHIQIWSSFGSQTKANLFCQIYETLSMNLTRKSFSYILSSNSVRCLDYTPIEKSLLLLNTSDLTRKHLLNTTTYWESIRTNSIPLTLVKHLALLNKLRCLLTRTIKRHMTSLQ